MTPDFAVQAFCSSLPRACVAGRLTVKQRMSHSAGARWLIPRACSCHPAVRTPPVGNSRRRHLLLLFSPPSAPSNSRPGLVLAGVTPPGHRLRHPAAELLAPPGCPGGQANPASEIISSDTLAPAFLPHPSAVSPLLWIPYQVASEPTLS